MGKVLHASYSGYFPFCLSESSPFSAARLEIVMKKYDIFKNKNIIDLSYGEYTKIIKVADIIKNLFKTKGINIKVIRGKKNDQLQKNKRNVPNTYLKKYWKPKFSLEQGIKEVFNFYFKKN